MRVKAESMILKNILDENKKLMAGFFSITPPEESVAYSSGLAETGQTAELHAGQAF